MHRMLWTRSICIKSRILKENQNGKIQYWCTLYGESEIDVTGVGTGGGEGTGGQPLLPTGDANLDGIVNVVDVVQIVNFILNQSTGEATFTDAEFWEANVIQDNIINIVDIVAIVSLILGDN